MITRNGSFGAGDGAAGESPAGEGARGSDGNVGAAGAASGRERGGIPARSPVLDRTTVFGRATGFDGATVLPAVMGILNVTPDSFSDGGRFNSIASALSRAEQIAASGAAILDLGGESTRPGSDPVSIEEELARVLPILDAFRGEFPIPISIDTRRAAVALAAAERGATILNDTAALRDDPEIASVARERGLTVVLMHRRGVPRTMQSGRVAPYADVVCEVRAFFEERVEAAIDAGIAREKLILDPGIGFGKRPEDNDHLMASLSELRLPGIPLLVGGSRKAFLGRFDPRAASSRLPGSRAVVASCAAQHVEYVRVHDVAETVAFLRTLRALEGPKDMSC